VAAKGLELNNPGNIRRTSTAWRGQDLDYHGPYCKFEAPEWGIRAIAKILMSYQKRGIRTIRGAITEWAPEADGNPTESYIANVAQWTGIDPDTPTFLETLPIIKAIIRQETGEEPYPDSMIELGITLANPQPET